MKIVGISFVILALAMTMVSVLFADSIRLGSGSFDPLRSSPSIPESLKSHAATAGKDYYLVQFKGFPDESAIQDLARNGAVLSYVPDNTYLVEADASRLEQIRSNPKVRWIGNYQPFYKLSPEIGKRAFSGKRRSKELYYLSVDLFPDANVDETVRSILALGGSKLSLHKDLSSARVRVWLPPNTITALAHLKGVQWIEDEPERTKRNGTTRWVIQSNVTNSTPIWNKGIHGEGQIIGHIDGLIATNSCYFNGPGKVVAVHNQSGDNLVDDHGTHTAGTAAGDRSPYGVAGSYDGNAFAAKIAHTDLCDVDPSGEKSGAFLCPDPNHPAFVTLEEALTNDHNDGARIHTNSWGDDNSRAYSADCRDIDKFSHEHEDDLVIFAVAGPPTIQSPENAKNVLAVAASKQAPNQNFSYSGVGTGPTTDGRRKPEIYAPGQNIVSAKTSCGTVVMSGTSMAAPAIAAAGAMVRQYYQEGWYPTGTKVSGNGFIPTGALIKATLLNGTVDMTGISGYPGNKEGWGRLLLDNALFFSGDSRSLNVHDVRNSLGFLTGSTSSDTYNISVTSGVPLKVALVWTDPESPVGASGHLINDLNLEVTTPSGIFKGNVFSGGQSATGGSFDTVNNVEQVLINSPATGNVTVRVTAGNIPKGKQGYALVVTGNFQSCTTPATPTGFNVTPGNSQNLLTWNPVSGASYNINRNTTGCSASFSSLASTSSTSFTDSSLTNGTTYYYQVVAVSGGCSSVPSTCQSGTPQGGGGGITLFSDNFDDGDSLGWNFIGTGTHIVNGQKQLEITGNTTLSAKPTYAGCDDCDLSIQLVIQSGNPAIYFPLIDGKNNREIRFSTDLNQVTVKERINSVITKSLVFPFSLPLGQSYSVLISNTGGTVNISINGTPLSLPTMTDFAPALFKLEAFKGTTDFDNILVTQ
jgi:Subtilase family